MVGFGWVVKNQWMSCLICDWPVLGFLVGGGFRWAYLFHWKEIYSYSQILTWTPEAKTMFLYGRLNESVTDLSSPICTQRTWQLFIRGKWWMSQLGMNFNLTAISITVCNYLKQEKITQCCHLPSTRLKYEKGTLNVICTLICTPDKLYTIIHYVMMCQGSSLEPAMNCVSKT